MSDITASVKAEDSKKGSGKKSGVDPSFNMDELRDLADLVDDHGLTEFEFENENIRVRISKMTAAPVVQAAPVAVPTASIAPAAASTASTDAVPGAEPASDLYKIPSPIVGTYYSAPGPDKDPYVSIGSKVSAETVVCIIEAMKLMNEIQAETSGEVVEIYVENGQPVEYGQPLFGIKK